MLSAIFSLETLWWLLMIIYIPACLGLILVVVLQKGKGMGFAGAFGAGGGSEAVFGPRTVRSLPQKITYTMAGLFLFLAMVMSMLSGRVTKGTAPDAVIPTEISAEEVNRILDSPVAPVEAVTTPIAPVEAPEDAAAVPAADATDSAPAMEVTPVEEAPAADTAPTADAPAEEAAPAAAEEAATSEASESAAQ